MKRLPLFKMIFLTLIIMLTVTGCGQQAAEPETKEDARHIALEFATFWPAGDFQVAEGHMSWAEEISKRVAEETPHTIEFKWHFAQSLLSMPELYEGTVQGVTDIATTCPSYTPGLFPITNVFEQPGFNNDNALVSSLTMHEAWKQSELLQQEYEDVKVMHFWATGPGDFITNTRVESMEDISGLNIRAVGGTIPWVRALGANPVSFGMGASYENLETGVVNGLLGPTDVLKGFRLAEVTKYITKSPPSYNIVFMKIMNWDTWNSLPESVQKIFDEVNEEFVSEYGKLRTQHTIIGEKYGVEEHGMEIITLDPAEYQRWESLIDPIMKEWVVKANAAGLPGQELMDMALELDAKFSEQYGDYTE